MFFRKYTFKDVNNIEESELKKRIKIVVIDDEEDSFPVSQIQSYGYTIEYWNQINSDNITRLEDNSFDIIILDIYGVVDQTLGSINGLDILKSIKKKNPNQLIIAFSGSSYEIDKGEFWKLADDFIKKPTSVFDIKERLEEIFRKNYSIEQLISQLKETISNQVGDSSNQTKIENLISKTILKDGELDYVKLARYGVQDSAAIVTLVSAIINLTKDS